MPKFTELPGASPPGPPPGLCPGPAGGLTAPPRPPPVFWSLWPRHYQNASDGPGEPLGENKFDLFWKNIYGSALSTAWDNKDISDASTVMAQISEYKIMISQNERFFLC